MSHIADNNSEPLGSPVYYRQQAGIGHVPAYQVAGIPFITGTVDMATQEETRVLFPRVTRSITVRNTGASKLRVAFASKFAAAGGGSDTHDGYHYITLDASGSAAATHAQGVANHLTMNVKAEKLFIYNPDANAAGAFEVFAELTHIPTGSWTLTGTGISSPIGT